MACSPDLCAATWVLKSAGSRSGIRTKARARRIRFAVIGGFDPITRLVHYAEAVPAHDAGFVDARCHLADGFTEDLDFDGEPGAGG